MQPKAPAGTPAGPAPASPPLPGAHGCPGGSIRYGAIELIIHDGSVVQLERREKVRCDVELTDPSTP
jgi:hypothetical protein